MTKTMKKPAPAAAAPAAPAADAPKRGPGRPKSGESDLPESVEELVALLETTEDQGQKRKIRARLRSRGHRGGLGKRGVKKEEAEAPAKPAGAKTPVKKPRPAAQPAE